MCIFVIKVNSFWFTKHDILFLNKSKGEDNMGQFTNKTIIITGGARGIGYGIATAFAKEGANLVITSIVQEELESDKPYKSDGSELYSYYSRAGQIRRLLLQGYTSI